MYLHIMYFVRSGRSFMQHDETFCEHFNHCNSMGNLEQFYAWIGQFY